ELDELVARGPRTLSRPPGVLKQALDAYRAGRATADDIEIIVDEIIADYRATRLVGAPNAPSLGITPGVLNYKALEGCCGQGRDTSAASLSTFVQNSGQTATIRRYQAFDVFEGLVEKYGVSVEELAEAHGFSIVEFEGLEGELYLVDPTFAQFLKPRMFGVV